MVTKVAHKDVRSDQQSAAAETVGASTARSTEATSDCDGLSSAPHRLEQDVRRSLLANPNVRIASLVVRRIPKGVCIEGVLETEEAAPDVCAVVRRIPGVSKVVNHLVVRHPPLKG